MHRPCRSGRCHPASRDHHRNQRLLGAARRKRGGRRRQALSERLITELTAHRTLALRDAVANDPGVAFATVLHALCLGAFYRMSSGSCLEIGQERGLQQPGAGARQQRPARAIEARHQEWAKQLPDEEDDLWEALVAFSGDSQAALFAHFVSLSVNAVHEPCNRSPRRLADADTLVRAMNLKMAATGWRPTVDNYLGRVPKARILEAVREARGEASAQHIDHLKKADMANEAERLLADTGWLPEPLRTADAQVADVEPQAEAAAILCRRVRRISLIPTRPLTPLRRNDPHARGLLPPRIFPSPEPGQLRSTLLYRRPGPEHGRLRRP